VTQTDGAGVREEKGRFRDRPVSEGRAEAFARRRPPSDTVRRDRPLRAQTRMRRSPEGTCSRPAIPVSAYCFLLRRERWRTKRGGEVDGTVITASRLRRGARSRGHRRCSRCSGRLEDTGESIVWMSHGDRVTRMTKGLSRRRHIGQTRRSPMIADGEGGKFLRHARNSSSIVEHQRSRAALLR